MSMPRAVRHINEMRVLDVVFRLGSASRASIARELDLTRSTAGNIVANLATEGLIIEDSAGDDKSAGTGRPGTLVRLNPTHALFLGAEIAVGRISVVALDFSGNIVSERHFPLQALPGDVTTALDQLAGNVREICRPLESTHPLKGLCVTLPGVIDNAGRVLRAPFLGWHNVPIIDHMRDRLPEMPTIVAENDANAFAIADGYKNDALAPDTEIHVFLDAGVGGAIMASGRLLRGRDGYAGEFGHMILGEEGFAKVATLAGSFESFIGRDAIMARHRHYGGDARTIEDFIEEASRGTAAAAAATADWSFYLGRGLAIISSIFNPSRIVLGGPVAPLFQLCRDDVIARIRSNLFGDQPIPEIALSPLGLEGPALGGAMQMHRTMFAVDEALVFKSNSPPRAHRP